MDDERFDVVDLDNDDDEHDLDVNYCIFVFFFGHDALYYFDSVILIVCLLHGIMYLYVSH
jgi:hypothetical protein